MSQRTRSIRFPIYGCIAGGIIGTVVFFWLMHFQAPYVEARSNWWALAFLFIEGIAVAMGGILATAITRIRQDLQSGGHLLPYFKTACQFGAISLIVLLVRGNRDPLDLLIMPVLGGLTAVVVSSLLAAHSSVSVH